MGNCWERKLILFDLDGCLIDTLPDIVGMVNLTRKKMGLPALDEEFVKSCIGGGGRKLWIKCTADAPERLEEAMSLAGPAYNECVADHSFPYPGVIDTLKALKGKRPMAVATNKVRAATMKLFREREMLEYFDYIICADDVTKIKPDPECIFTVLDHFGLKPEDAVLVGDTPTDVLTARNAGVDTIGVTYGMAKREDLAASGPLFMVDTMEEVLELLLPPEER